MRGRVVAELERFVGDTGDEVTVVFDGRPGEDRPAPGGRIVSVVAWIRYADRLLDASAAQTEPLFPSPAGSGADRPPT
jgi:hypothetical protein